MASIYDIMLTALRIGTKDKQQLLVNDVGALIVTGDGVEPSATAIRLQDGTVIGQYASVNEDGAVLVDVPGGIAKDETSVQIRDRLGVKIDEAPTLPAGGVGVIGWLSNQYQRLVDLVTNSGNIDTTLTNIDSTLDGIANEDFATEATLDLAWLELVDVNTQLGTDPDTVTPARPAGATGVRGALWSIWNRINEQWTVTVDNFPADPATAAGVDAVKDAVDAFAAAHAFETGPWDYYAGTSGTVNVAGSERVKAVHCVAGLTGASVTIDGGDTITVGATRTFSVSPGGRLQGPVAIVFTGTTSYTVEVLS